MMEHPDISKMLAQGYLTKPKVALKCDLCRESIHDGEEYFYFEDDTVVCEACDYDYFLILRRKARKTAEVRQ